MIVESDSKFKKFINTFFNKNDAKNVVKNRHNINITIISQLTFKKYCKRKIFKLSYYNAMIYLILNF